MQKVRIIALNEVKYELIKSLHDLGVIEIRKSSLELSEDKALDQFPDISKRLVRFQGALAILKVPKKGSSHIKFQKHMSVEELFKKCDSFKVVDEIYNLDNERKQINERMKAIDEALNTAELFEGTGINFGKLQSNALQFRAFLTSSENFDAVKSRMESRGIRNEIIEKSISRGEVLTFAAYEKAKNKEFDDILRDMPHQEIDFSSNKYLDSTPKEVLAKVSKLKKESADRLKEIIEELAAISKGSYYDVAGLTEMLEIEYERANISTNFKRTGNTFVIEGWIPKKKLNELKTSVKNATDGKYEIEELHDKELAPTLINRPGFLQPFDYLMEFFSLPRSDEIDPTYIFIISLAIFYGLTVSDVGYGLLSLLVAYILVKKTDPTGLLNNVAKVWMMFSVSIIFFGLISNQFFGFSLPFFKGIQLFDWLKDIQTLILLTILIGITQVTLGQIFSFINHWHHGERVLAISKILSIFAIIFGVIAIGGWFFSAFPSSLYIPSTVVAVVAIIGTAAMSGIEAGEITNLISHPLSYIRLFGFGLASVIIASLIDRTFAPSLAQGPVVFILYLVIFIILHLMNMLLSIFEGIVQSARLNFVEFFSKFYKGNGIKFRPYYYKRRYTKI